MLLSCTVGASTNVRSPTVVSFMSSTLRKARPILLYVLANTKNQFSAMVPTTRPHTEEQANIAEDQTPKKIPRSAVTQKTPAIALNIKGRHTEVSVASLSVAARRREVQARAAFQTNVITPLNQRINPVLQQLKKDVAVCQRNFEEIEEKIRQEFEKTTEKIHHAVVPGAKARKWRNRVRSEGSAHRTLYCAAPHTDVVEVASDVVKYQDWTGNGIKRIDVLSKTKTESVVRYNAGALGLSFDFTLKWKRETSQNSVPYVLTFENVGSGGLLQSLSGAYVIDKTRDGVSKLSFDFTSEAPGLPKVIKNALGNMVVDIATNELRNYVEARALERVQGLPETDGNAKWLREIRKKVDVLELGKPRPPSKIQPQGKARAAFAA